jgi:thiamine-monophosphate kinase
VRRLRDVGEFGLIGLIQGWIGADPSRRVVLGPGDDAAVLRMPAGRELVVSTDSAVEGVHFRFRTQAARTIGRRAMVANLSDLAAMGAAPLACVAALCAPPELELRLAKGLVQGILDEASAHACPLVGGNLASARETQLTLAVVGTVERGRALRRHRVRAGDGIFVTGSLGGAALAVRRAERSGTRIRTLPVPRLAAGRALGRMRGVGGCIDVSDGLAGDLAHLLEGSGLGAEIDAARVPTPPGFRAACARLGLDPRELCLAGGEDYELLFTLRPRAPRRNLARRLGVPVSELGRITREPGIRGLGEARGWRHF